MYAKCQAHNRFSNMVISRGKEWRSLTSPSLCFHLIITPTASLGELNKMREKKAFAGT